MEEPIINININLLQSADHKALIKPVRLVSLHFSVAVISLKHRFNLKF